MTQKLNDITNLFHVDALSMVITALVAFVALSIGSFSIRYLKGDRKQRHFFMNLVALVSVVFLMVSSDHIFLLLAFWGVSNYLLTRLMLHKQQWEAARQSSILALKNFAVGFIFLASGLLVLYFTTGETSIQVILTKSIEAPWMVLSGMLLLMAAMTQSALWPFHRWLTSSLNSPTPVSAIMHAGLVNGGGFLLARFAPILIAQPTVLNVVLIVGIATALLGTLWKLMQSDIKRMLASSTMGQMGFMIAQCGLGLFPAAVAHLCWHGLFKAYLFLASGSAAKEKRLDLDYPPSFKHFSIALICGIIAAYMFTVTSGKQVGVADTTLFLTFLAMLAGTQFALTIIRGNANGKLFIAIIATTVMGACYGFSVYLIEYILEPLGISAPQQLNFLHLIAAVVLTVSWLGMLFLRPEKQYPEWVLKKYVQMLNASQPHPKTVTTHRNKYQF